MEVSSNDFGWVGGERGACASERVDANGGLQGREEAKAALSAAAEAAG